MAETDPKTVQDLTSVVRGVRAGPRPRHPGRRRQGPRTQASSLRPRGSRPLEAVFAEASPAEAAGHRDPPGASGWGPLRLLRSPDPTPPHPSLNRTLA